MSLSALRYILIKTEKPSPLSIALFSDDGRDKIYLATITSLISYAEEEISAWDKLYSRFSLKAY